MSISHSVGKKTCPSKRVLANKMENCVPYIVKGLLPKKHFY